MKLPPELALIAGGVGVNAIAIILERLSQEEKKQDHENYVITVDHAYARLACNAISESGFKSAVSKEKFFERVNAIQCRKDVSNNGLPELLQVFKLLKYWHYI